MRLALGTLFLAAGTFYAAGAFHSYREELAARATGAEPSPDGFSHPEANLRLLREAIEVNDYSDRLLPHLRGALEEAPSFYQPPLLIAAFYANRLEHPELIRESFEAAVKRFPSNGRLHLTYAEWLLAPRPTAPYRAYREQSEPETRTTALTHLATATALEPDLGRQAIGLMLRFGVPAAEWADRMPRSDDTLVLILEGLDRDPADPVRRRKLLEEFLQQGSSNLDLLRWIAYYGDRWGEREIGRSAALKWREAAIAAGAGEEIARATVSLARLHFAAGAGDRAYSLLRETLSVLEERSLSSQHALDLLCAVGDEYLNRRQHAMAQALYSEAITISREHVPAYFGLARNYRAIGDLESARGELQEVLSIDPSNSQAIRELEQLAILSSSER